MIDASTLVLIFSMLQECLILIYYSNSTMIYKRTRLLSNAIIVMGYIFYGCICVLYKNTLLNIVSFSIIIFVIFVIGFRESFWEAAFKALMLTGFMMVGELIISIIMNMQIENNFDANLNVANAIIYSAASKLIYLSCVVILKRMSLRRRFKGLTKEVLWLTALPIATCTSLCIFSEIAPSISYGEKGLLVVLSAIMLISDFIVYIVYDIIIDKNIKIHYLQEVEYKNELDFKSYQLIRKKYDELKIMVHDFNKYCNNIEAYLNGNEKFDDILQQIQKLRNKNKEFLLVEYTNNRALNVLLSQKMEDCNREGIDFQIYIQNVDISYITEMDIVAIFANLIDNAIEGSISSKEKKIFLSIYTMNNAYIVIRVDNSSDYEPEIVNGRLKTKKNDEHRHGIGIISIEHALKNYDGNMHWSYDKKSHIFTNIILINFLKNMR